MKPALPAIAASLTLTFAFSGCETPGQNAMLGAGTGAAIGGLLHGSGHDAVKGAAIGAGAGYLLGKILQNDRRNHSYDEYDSYSDRGYPVATPTNRPGFVTSPYRPYNLIDVRGIPGGAKVVDPSCQRVFINP